MFRLLTALFFLTLSFGFFWTLYRFETRLSSLRAPSFESKSCESASSQVSENVTTMSTEGVEVPSVTENDTATIKLVRLCQGLSEREMLDDDGVSVSVSVPRTIIFFRSDEGIPDIITARVINARDQNFAPTNISSHSALDNRDRQAKELGLVAEHGLLEDLKAIDEATESNRYQQLLEESSDLCLGEYSSVSQFEADSEILKNEVEALASAYISMDYDLNSPDTQILLYFKMNGKIYQQDLRSLLLPI